MYSESRPPTNDRPTEDAATSNDMTFLPITNLIRSLPAPAPAPPFGPLS